MRLKAQLEVGVAAKSSEQIKLEAKLREETTNNENLLRINLILQDRIKKLENVECVSLESEALSKLNERLEKSEQKVANLTEERRKSRKDISKLKEDRDELRKKYSELQEKS